MSDEAARTVEPLRSRVSLAEMQTLNVHLEAGWDVDMSNTFTMSGPRPAVHHILLKMLVALLFSKTTSSFV